MIGNMRKAAGIVATDISGTDAVPLPSGKADHIRGVLERRFGTGFYRFGDKLSVSELAKEFRVSRQPIMAALGDLRNDGFVIIKPQVGCEAVHPSKAVIEDFFSVFAKMDGTMAGLAAQRREPHELALLKEVLGLLKAASGNPKEWDLEQLDRLVSRYHDIIRGMAKSPVLASRVGRFWMMANYIIRNGKHNYTEKMHAIANRQRRDIMRAIAKQDAAAAETLMANHVLGKPSRVLLL
jgi:DNA-binding GntR family transcriptional regulator